MFALAINFLLTVAAAASAAAASLFSSSSCEIVGMMDNDGSKLLSCSFQLVD